MKWLISYLFTACLLLLAVTFITGCATSGGGVSGSSNFNNNSTVAVENPSIELTDYLRRIPGVSVSGNGPSARVTIRGISTILGNPYPLFVVNDIRVGRDFRTVYSHVNMYDVTSIEVLKGSQAALYGMDGGNGVIEINY